MGLKQINPQIRGVTLKPQLVRVPGRAARRGWIWTHSVVFSTSQRSCWPWSCCRYPSWMPPSSLLALRRSRSRHVCTRTGDGRLPGETGGYRDARKMGG